MQFTKMQGIGNDFILINGFRYPDLGQAAAIAKKVCDRHFGIGADGLIWMEPSDHADAKMRIFNTDGSEAEMCGNGLRCAARFVHDLGIVRGDVMKIDTLAGDLTVTLCGGDVTADMGKPILAAERIPVNASSNQITLNLCGRTLSFFCVSMGNPHAVTFDCYPDDDDFHAMGAQAEHDPIFPARANIEFCRIRDDGIDVRVWERGSGETLACGTGACAVLTAAASLGLTGREADVRLPGGTLHILWNQDDHLIMTGPAETAYTGELEI